MCAPVCLPLGAAPDSESRDETRVIVDVGMGDRVAGPTTSGAQVSQAAPNTTATLFPPKPNDSATA